MGTKSTTFTIAATTTGVIAALASIVTAPASAAPASYQLTSSSYHIDPLHTSTHTGECADGFHVDGEWKLSGRLGAIPGFAGSSELVGGDEVWNANLTPHGDWITVWNFSGQDQNGVDSKNNPTYQAVSVELLNSSVISSHDGSFTWTCDPN
jgi:hypothetical protein